MATSTKFGSIKRVNLSANPSYDVLMDDRSTLRVSHDLIRPTAAKLLKPGCRLLVRLVNGRIESASTDLTSPEENKASQLTPGLYQVTVKTLDPLRGVVTVTNKDGIAVKVRIQKHEKIWSNIFIGRKLEMEVSAGLDGKAHFVLRPIPAARPAKPAEKPSTVAPTFSNNHQVIITPPPVRRKESSQDLPPTGKEGNNQETHSYSQDDQAGGERIGIDPDYFRQRKQENHRHEIMAFLEEHLVDNLIEWYQMSPSKRAHHRQPASPLKSEVEQSLHTIDPRFTDLYNHQALALDAIRDGKNLVVVTQTASGKTLCYNPAIFENMCGSNPNAHALYVFPLNALMTDQKEKIDQLVSALGRHGNNIKAEILRGGMGTDARRTMAVSSPNILATNPEMLGVILGEWERWQDFFSGLRYVVIDEVHSYRGILGMHTAGLLRRLQLTVGRVGQMPQFILSSATVSNPLDLATRLTGLPESSFVLLNEKDDGSGQECKHWVVLNPDYHQQEVGYDQYLSTAALTMVELLVSRNQAGKSSPLNTILFARSIRDVNKIFRIVQENLRHNRPELARKVRKYVSAELSTEEKKEIYQGLKSGGILGVISTNALEAGIDIGKLDACIIAGFPFWVMRMRQMAGRIGRQQEGLVAFVPHPANAIDQFYRDHPGLLMTQPPEVFVVDPNNHYIHRKHINAAAFHLKGISQEELDVFGEKARATARQAVADHVMSQNRERYFGSWRNYQDNQDAYAINGIRSQEQIPYVVCQSRPGTACSLNSACFDSNKKNDCDRRVTVLDQQYAYRDCHPGAIYESKEGELYRVIEFDDDHRLIVVQRMDDQSLERTFVEEETTLDLEGPPKSIKNLSNGIELRLGEALVTRSFTGYYTYTLIPRRRCRRCKISFDSSTNLCPRCSRPTTKFYDRSDLERQVFPEPYLVGLTIRMNTMACWMTTPAQIEENLDVASPCKLPAEGNLVMRFLQKPSRLKETGRLKQWKEAEVALLEKYYEQAGKSLRGRSSNLRELVVFPGVYGQCLLHALRLEVEESRALEIFEALTGYPVTDDLDHVCRKCQTSVLLPALHTLEHTVRQRYPSVALGDPTDLAGLTLLGHPQTAAPVIFWYDNYQGGLGAADKVFDQFERLLLASDATLSGCTCSSLEGCPHCTQVGHCDKHNGSLSKLAARCLIAIAGGSEFEIPFEPLSYPAAKKSEFEKENRKNEHRQSAHGVGAEAPEAPASSDPYQVLRVQRKVHDPVLNKAYLVRSEEITHELPPVSAVELNQAYLQVNGANRPKEWGIRQGMKAYEILEILPQASLNMVQGIYRVIAREIHPDVYSGDKLLANEMMRLVNEAYERITREKKKENNQHDL